jgi:Zn-dependent M28 family amino/carboxypeptidase
VVVPGKSADSVVVIVHYDSIGPAGQETSNPGVDDDMSGMAAMLEAARLLSDPCRHAANTLRFVASDYEEQTNPGLEGARQYASYIKNLSTTQGFKLVAAQDYEQSGWNCAIDNACGGVAGGSTFYVMSCSGSEDNNRYDFPALGDALLKLTASLSPLKVSRTCIAAHSDHYAMWEIGVPAVVTAEYGDNPRYDQAGGDTFARIDLAYHAKISRLAIAFTAQLAGVSAQ